MITAVGDRSGRSLSETGVIATFNVDQKSGRELRQYLGTVAAQCSRPPASNSPTVDNCTSSAAEAECLETTHVSQLGPPAVIILDDLHHVGSASLLADAFSVLLGLPLHDW